MLNWFSGRELGVPGLATCTRGRRASTCGSAGPA